jgi:hypothetical protein
VRASSPADALIWCVAAVVHCVEAQTWSFDADERSATSLQVACVTNPGGAISR